MAAVQCACGSLVVLLVGPACNTRSSPSTASNPQIISLCELPCGTLAAPSKPPSYLQTSNQPTSRESRVGFVSHPRREACGQSRKTSLGAAWVSLGQSRKPGAAHTSGNGTAEPTSDSCFISSARGERKATISGLQVGSMCCYLPTLRYSYGTFDVCFRVIVDASVSSWRKRGEKRFP